MDKEKQEEFEKLAKPLIKWLNDNMHPHAKVIIETGRAEVIEGYYGFTTDKYIKD